MDFTHTSNQLFRKAVAVSLIFCFSCMGLYAQNEAALQKLRSFISHAELFGHVYPQEKVYLHFDNTNYYIGETIWFKAYVVDAAIHQATAISKVLYVELLNNSGITVETKKLKIEEGSCHGEFLLSHKLQAGFYEVRAYTRYMLNFASEKRATYTFKNGIPDWEYEQTEINDGNYTLFSRVFPVYDAPESAGDYSWKRMKENPRHTALSFPEMEKKKKETHLKLQFFPEGGQLVNGIESRVAFEALDDNSGKPIPLQGEIVDNKGDVLTRFEANLRGRGFFIFTPEAKKEYHARFYYAGKTSQTALPESQISGYVMRVDSDTAHVSVVLNKAVDAPAELLGLSISCRGKVQLFDTLTIADSAYRLLVPLEALSAGVNQITLFNEQGNIEAERLFFVYPPKKLYSKIRVSGKRGKLTPYEAIKLDFEIENSSGEATESHFSLAIHDQATREDSYYQGNILSNLLLSSDLKGFIENADSYLHDTSASGRSKLDLLMLVQGWRRYNWKDLAGVNNFKLRYQAERALTIDGYVMDINSATSYYNRFESRRIANVELKLNLFTDSLLFEGMVTTAKDGFYSFSLDDDLYGTNLITLKVSNPKNRKIMSNAIPLIERVFSPDIEPYSYFQTHFPFEHSTVMETRNSESDTAAYFVPFAKELDDVVVKGKKIKRGVIHYEFPDIVMDAEEMYDWAMDLSLLEKKNLLYKGNYPMLPRYRLFGTLSRIREVDGRIYTNQLFPDLIRSMSERIDSFKIYTNMAMRDQYKFKINKKEITPTAVVCWKMFPSGYKRPYKNNDPGLRHTKFKMYDRPVEFYHPDYSLQTPPDSVDVRRTLYWNPNVKTDKAGKASIHFYNNSKCENIHISAEGISKEGKIILLEDK